MRGRALRGGGRARCDVREITKEPRALSAAVRFRLSVAKGRGEGGGRRGAGADRGLGGAQSWRGAGLGVALDNCAGYVTYDLHATLVLLLIPLLWLTGPAGGGSGGGHSTAVD